MARHERWARIGYGIALLFWLGAEDTETLPIALLGLLGAVLGVGGWAWRTYGQTPLTPATQRLALVLTGGLIGASAALISTLLMFLKTGWHNHPFPDFPFAMMIAMLERAPVWAMAGAMLAGAWVLWRFAGIGRQ